MSTKNKRSIAVRLALGFSGAVLLAALIFILLLCKNHTLVGGWAVRRDETTLDCRDLTLHSTLGLRRLRQPEELDLRGSELSLRSVQRLQKHFPDCSIRWDVPIGNERFDSASLAVEPSSLDRTDLAAFACFPALQCIDARGIDDYALLTELTEQEAGREIIWDIALGGERCRRDEREIHLLESDAVFDELMARLPYFTDLSHVYVAGRSLTPEEQLALREAYPGISFHWEINAAADVYASSDAKELSLAGHSGFTLEELKATLPLFPALERIDLSDCGFSDEELLAFRKTLPELEIRWTFKLFGVTVGTTDREIDISGCAIDSLQQVEDSLFYFPYLEKVLMMECGFSNEEMDALDKRYEDIRFVWTVHFGAFFLRTDATAFIATTFPYGYSFLTNAELQNLRYCRDLIALDLGHMEYSDTSFLEDLPKLRWLIMADTRITDISVLANMKDLYYLELFQTNISDISPLLECKNLRHLNLAYCYLQNGHLLGQMPWLERLWVPGTGLGPGGYEAVWRLPNTKVEMWCEGSTGGTWRTDAAYYEMRDVFGAHYMPG
ncbi:MAG: leucine-rich repeat domain-containing protein [Ruminococcaceae bacterium]|nr:leucine-rich repeat domain-containing protein [Oscillospiraceae bacterium]